MKHKILKFVLQDKTLATTFKNTQARTHTQCCHLPVHECIFKQWRHRIDVILAHLADILEHKGQRFEDAILYVQLRYSVLVHETGQHCERGARLGNDCYGNRGADSVLSFLDLQVVEKCCEYVVRTADKCHTEIVRVSDKTDTG